MKKFKIPVSYEVYGEITVEARTAEEALKYAIDNLEMIKLPDDVEYVDGSFAVNYDIELVIAMNEKGEDN